MVWVLTCLFVVCYNCINSKMREKMPLSIYRRKLLNAILFFISNTRYVNTTKLLKLLSYLDFIHFRQTGYPSIGLTYYTYKKGPVPVRFWKEIQKGVVPSDLKDSFSIIIRRDDSNSAFKEFKFVAHSKPDLSYFTPRETRILEELANKYKYTRAKHISEDTHLPNQPWDTTIKTRGENVPIDYLVCLDKDSDVDWDTAKNNLSEFYAAVKNFKVGATKAAEVR